MANPWTRIYLPETKALRRNSSERLIYRFNCKVLDVEQQTLWVFQSLLDADQKGYRFLAVDDPVIV